MITDHLSILRASLQWAEDRGIHHADEAVVERCKQSLRQSIAHFKRVHDEQAASGKMKMSLAGDQPPGNADDSALRYTKAPGPASSAAAGGVRSINIADMARDAVDFGLAHPLNNAARSTAGESDVG